MPITPPATAVMNSDGSLTWNGINGAREKNVAHYLLTQVKLVCQALGNGAFAPSTMPDLTRLGLTRAQALGVIAGMKRDMFFKSMESLKCGGHWQDVYHVPIPPNGAMAYVKFTPVMVAGRAAHMVISFKTLL